MRSSGRALSAAAVLLHPVTAAAVENARGLSISELPRPGYESGRWRFGSFVLTPLITAETHYDSNVFATSRDDRGDAIFNIGPRLDVVSEGSRLTVEADAELNAQQHATYTTEDRVTFGVGAKAAFQASSADRLDGNLRFDRGAVSRSDPEEDPTLRRPSKYDVLLAEFGYSYRPNRIGIAVHGGVQRANFLPAADADRDLTSYNASLRLSWAASARLNLFVQAYGNRRDARLPFDRSGINRGTKTIGALAGVTFDISGKLTGEIGVGGFKANPDDPSLSSFSDVALRGDLTWSPVPRTIIKLRALRGDNGTIRSGASGRVNTVASIGIDQEARHNLLLHATVAYEDTVYRGFLTRHLSQYAVNGEVEFLVARAWSVFADAGYTDRRANNIFDRYRRTTAGIGVRLRT